MRLPSSHFIDGDARRRASHQTESDGSLAWMLWLLIMFAGWLADTVSGAAGFGGALLLLPVLTYTVGAKAAGAHPHRRPTAGQSVSCWFWI